MSQHSSTASVSFRPINSDDGNVEPPVTCFMMISGRRRATLLSLAKCKSTLSSMVSWRARQIRVLELKLCNHTFFLLMVESSSASLSLSSLLGLLVHDSTDSGEDIPPSNCNDATVSGVATAGLFSFDLLCRSIRVSSLRRMS